MSIRSLRSVVAGKKPPVMIPGNTTVTEAARRMREGNTGAAMVLEGTRLAGIFTERDLLVRVAAAGLDLATTKLRDVMTADPETIGAEEPVEDAVRRMDAGGFRHLVVVDGGRVLGVVSTRDIPALTTGRMAKELDQRHRLAERAW